MPPLRILKFLLELLVGIIKLLLKGTRLLLLLLLLKLFDCCLVRKRGTTTFCYESYFENVRIESRLRLAPPKLFPD